MTTQPQLPIEIPIGGIAGGHLTSGTYPAVLNAFLKELPEVRSGGRARIDLGGVEWIDHLPLLSVCMALNQCAQLQLDSCEVILPEIPERESFLERWGFFNLLDQLGVSAEISDNREPYEESEYSRMLPITRVANIREVGVVRDLLLRAEGDLLKVLREQACLQDSDVSGLADLVVFELCKNVVEHSKCESGGFAIAHASRPGVSQAGVRNRFAAP